MPYSSDLTDAKWEIFEPLLLEILPQKKQARPSDWTSCQFVSADWSTQKRLQLV
jgi:hypothetical protein